MILSLIERNVRRTAYLCLLALYLYYTHSRSARYPNFSSAREGRDFKGKDCRWRDATTGILAGALFLLFLDSCRCIYYFAAPIELRASPGTWSTHGARQI